MIRHQWLKLPKLIRFMLTHIANGIVVGCVLVLGLIWLDIRGVGTLLAGSGLATALLFFQVSFTFGAVSMGVAVMNLGED